MKTHLNKLLTKKGLFIALGVFFVLSLGYRYISTRNGEQLETLTATKGTITQQVIVTGKSQPIDDINLAFEKSGKVVRVGAEVGSKVTKGQVLVQLEAGELAAQLREARGNVDAQRARLTELERGARPEEIEVKRTELKKAEQDLSNYYTSIPNVLNEAYAKADDAVRKQLDDFFTNDEQTNPQLTFVVNNSQGQTTAESDRAAMSTLLTTWRKSIDNISLSSQDTLDAVLVNSATNLDTIRRFLDKMNDLLNSNVSLSATNLTAYKASLNTARTNVNAAITSVSNQSQTIASQKVTVARIKNELSLTLAGSLPEVIQGQNAQIEQALARMQSIEVQLGKTTLRSPIDGIVTKQDAELGELVVANTQIVSVISEGKLEIDSNIPEVDIGKITIGNPVKITLDALPGENFTGKVGYIDPAETIVDGVVNFKVTIQFDAIDPRFKSGLTANLEIETTRKENVLILPQFAIIENDEGTFVEKISADGATEQTKITIGIRGQDGNVEILSGVKEGDIVVNVSSRSRAK